MVATVDDVVAADDGDDAVVAGDDDGDAVDVVAVADVNAYWTRWLVGHWSAYESDVSSDATEHDSPHTLRIASSMTAPSIPNLS